MGVGVLVLVLVGVRVLGVLGVLVGFWFGVPKSKNFTLFSPLLLVVVVGVVVGLVVGFWLILLPTSNN